METSTVVPGGDLAGRSAEYRRGYWRGWLAGSGWPLCLFCILCVSFVGLVGLWSISIQRDRADRAEAQLAEMRARGFTGPSARDGDVVMLRWDNGGWRPMSARLPLAGGTITGQNLHFGGAPLMPVSTTPHVVDRFSHTDDDVEVR